MAKTRKINRRGKTKPARQGSMGPKHSQTPKTSGVPSNTTPAKATMMNTSMTKPGSGTHGSGKGAR